MKHLINLYTYILLEADAFDLPLKNCEQNVEINNIGFCPPIMGDNYVETGYDIFFI